MEKHQDHVSKLYVAAYRNESGFMGSFTLHTLDKEYMTACVKAFLMEFTRKHGAPDRMRVWVE